MPFYLPFFTANTTEICLVFHLVFADERRMEFYLETGIEILVQLLLMFNLLLFLEANINSKFSKNI